VVFRRERVVNMMLGEMMTLVVELDDTIFVRSPVNGSGFTG